MNEKEFRALIEAYQAGRATEAEKALLEAWFDARRKRSPYEALSDNEKESIKGRVLERISARLKGRAPMEPGRNRQPRRIVYWAAAVAMALGVFSYSLLKPSPVQEDKIMVLHSVVSTDDTKKIIFADSSIAWLRGNSSIFYPEKFDGPERKVVLEGEALFEVAKDPEHPFIIECGELLTSVLGTSFNIKAGEAQTEIIVLTGKVSITSKHGGEHVTIQPNEKAVYYHTKRKIEKIAAKAPEIVATMAKTEYSMRFDATGLDEVIQRIEGKFDVRVVLSDPLLNNCTITADFTDQSLQSTLSMIAKSLKLTYTTVDGVIILNGKPCDKS